MTDPFSIAAGIAGIVSLSGHIFHGINSFRSHAGGAQSAVAELGKQTRNLSGVLQNLSLLAASLEGEPKLGGPNVSFRVQQVNACRQTLHRIETRLKKAQDDFATGSKRKAVSRSLKWPFSVEETKRLLDEMAHHRQTLELALSADTIATLMQCLAKQDAVGDEVGKLRDAVERRLSIDARVELHKGRSKVVKFFLRTNPQASFQTCLSLRQPMTGLWLTEGNPVFAGWKYGHNAKLLLSGIPGAGKTVLCGSVIEEVLQESSESVAVAFFFCDYKNEKSQETTNILCVVAAQLAQQSDEAFQQLQAYYATLHPEKGLNKEPSISDLLEVVQKMAGVYRKVFIVIDGLDECGANIRDVLRSLKKLIQTSPSVSMALFSRDEPEIREELADGFEHVEIAAHTEDLELYVWAEMASRSQLRTLAVTNPTLDEEIRQALINGAKGMFRWVACQLDHLCDLPTDRARRKALKELPPTLFGTYDRILERLLSKPPEARKIVQKALYWTGLGLGLTMAELCEAVSVPDDVDEMDTDDVVSESEITSRCSSLVRKSFGDRGLEFAHFTVLEYLQRIDSSSPLAFFRFTRRAVVSSCVSTAFRFLTFADFERRPVALPSEKSAIDERHEAHPFHSRAARMFLWSSMGIVGQEEALAELLQDSEFFRYAEKLFDPGKAGIFLSWMLANPLAGKAKREVAELVGCVLRPGFTPLHVAAALSQTAVCRFLLEKGVDASSSCELGTPLHLALGGPWIMQLSPAEPSHDHLDWQCMRCAPRSDTAATISLLLDHGADAAQTRLSVSALATAIRMSMTEGDLTMLLPFLRPATLVPDDALQQLENIETFATRGYRKDLLEDVLSRVSQSGPSSNLSRLLPVLLRVLRHVSAEVPSLPKAMQHVADMSDEGILDAVRAAAEFNLGEDLKILVKYVVSARRDRALRAGKNPMLHFAAGHNSEGAVAALLDCRFDVDATDEDGRTALDICCERGHVKTAEVLLERGARTGGGPGARGRGAWHVAAYRDDAGMLSLLFRYDGESARSLAAVSDDGNTPLACAVLAGAGSAARLILECCQRPYRQELFRSNLPLLHAAAGFSDQDLFCQLLDTGVDLQEMSGDGSTPLHHLRPSSPGVFVEYLLSRYDHLQPRGDGKIPLELVLSRLENRLEAVDEETVRRILPPDHVLPRAGAERVHLWAFFCSEIVSQFNSPCSNHLNAGSNSGGAGSSYSEPSYGSRDARFSDAGQQMFEESKCSAKIIRCATDILVSCGVLSSFEATSGTPVFEPLFLALLARRPSPPQVGSALSCAWVVPVVEAVFEATNLPKKEARSVAHGRLLTEAIRSRVPLLVAALLRHHADVHSDIHPDLGPDSPIEAACSTADLATLQAVLEHADRARIDEARPHSPPLLFRIAQGPGPQGFEKTRALLMLGADPTAAATGPAGERMSLISVAAEGDQFGIVELLHEAGADLYGEHAGFTVATAAASRGNIAVLEKLLRGDAPPGYWAKTSEFKFLDGGGTMRVLGDGCSLLHAAAASRNARVVQYLLDQDLGLDVDAVSGHGVAPLHVAVVCGITSVVKALLGRGAGVNVRDKAGYLPLDHALWLSDYSMVHVLTKAGSMPTSVARLKGVQALVLKGMGTPSGGCRPSQRGFDLESAIMTGNLEACQAIVDKGCSIDNMIPSCQACPPLFAAVKFDEPGIISWLMSRGASPDNVSCRQVPEPLRSLSSFATYHLTSMECLEQLLTYVLDRGVDAYAWPYNPLHIAARKGSYTALKTIIRHIRSHDKAYRRTTGFEGNGGSAAVPEPLLSHLVNKDQGLPYDTSSALPWAPPPPGVIDTRGTPLHISSFSGHTEAVRILIEAGADVNAIDQLGRSPLALAIQRGFREMVTLLLNAGAHLDHRSAHNFTPLMAAAKAGDLPMVELLDARGADLFATDDYEGVTALDLAADHPGRPNVFAYLLSRGVPLGRNIYGVTTTERALRQPSLRSLVFHAGLMRVHTDSLEQLLSHVISTYRNQYSFVRKFCRAVPAPVAQRLTNRRSRFWWSPLCLAAAENDVASACVLLDNGAEIDLEGSPVGGPLMVACSFGRLDAVRLLVRRGAKLEYTSEGGDYRNAFALALSHTHIIGWFVAERFREQRGITLCPSHGDAEVKPWAGVRAFRYHLPRDLWQRQDESMIEVLPRRRAFRERIRGKVVR